MLIVNFFYELAKEHRNINGFRYGNRGKKGAGNDQYPLMWLDDPWLWNGINEATGEYTVNLDILGIPEDDTQIESVQESAEAVGFDIIQRILELRPQTQMRVTRYSSVTLSEYTDDNAAGMRFTYTIAAPSSVDRCANNFDPDKKFPGIAGLPSFKTDAPDGCAIFNDGTGLPNFKLDQ